MQTPPRLEDMQPQALRFLIATAAGVLAHKTSAAETSDVLCRIGERLRFPRTASRQSANAR